MYIIKMNHLNDKQLLLLKSIFLLDGVTKSREQILSDLSRRADSVAKKALLELDDERFFKKYEQAYQLLELRDFIADVYEME